MEVVLSVASARRNFNMSLPPKPGRFTAKSQSIYAVIAVTPLFGQEECSTVVINK
jgi:hypothetical protein